MNKLITNKYWEFNLKVNATLSNKMQLFERKSLTLFKQTSQNQKSSNNKLMITNLSKQEKKRKSRTEITNVSETIYF